MNVILDVDYVIWQSPSIHLIPLCLFLAAGASPGCHWGERTQDLSNGATAVLPDW